LGIGGVVLVKISEEGAAEFQFHFHSAARQHSYVSASSLVVMSSGDNRSARRRIDTSVAQHRWRFKCPECKSTNWRAHNGTFGCRSCDTTLTELLDAKTGEVLSRDEIEFVGPHANHKGVEAYPPGLGGYR
jgi:protein-arginine kinase activator protein McsA